MYSDIFDFNTASRCPTGSITMQCRLLGGKQKLAAILVECRLPRELGAYTNSVCQALFSPPPHKSLGIRLLINILPQ